MKRCLVWGMAAISVLFGCAEGTLSPLFECGDGASACTPGVTESDSDGGKAGAAGVGGTRGGFAGAVTAAGMQTSAGTYAGGGSGGVASTAGAGSGGVAFDAGASARYVRICFVSLPDNTWASFYELKVMGT